MYASFNFPTKSALKRAFAAGQQIGVFQPYGDLHSVESPRNGTVCVEGPHFPKTHRWYAQVTLRDGLIIKVK